MTRAILRIGLVVAALSLAGCASGGAPREHAAAAPPLVGQWRSRVQFGTGAFAAITDLEFMYVFNQGGTMTESSNYDGVPPVPPAYGIWRPLGENAFEAKYEFYPTKPPARLEELAGGGGWAASGRGVFVERLTLSADGRSFTSTLRYEAFDAAGQPVAGGGEARGQGTRLEF